MTGSGAALEAGLDAVARARIRQAAQPAGLAGAAAVVVDALVGRRRRLIGGAERAAGARHVGIGAERLRRGGRGGRGGRRRGGGESRTSGSAMT